MPNLSRSLALTVADPAPVGDSVRCRRAIDPIAQGRTLAPHDLSTSQVLDVTGSPSVADLPPSLPLVSRQDLVYSRVRTLDGEPLDLKLDLLLPGTGGTFPLVVFVPGGGFLRADRTAAPELRTHLARAGYAVASLEYRVVPQGRYVEAVADVKAAIRFLRAHAERFGLDPGQVGVWGQSAGGYLSAMVATTPRDPRFEAGEHLDQRSDVQAAVDVYGLSDLGRVAMDYDPETQRAHQSPRASEALFLHGPDSGRSAQEDPEAAAAANPATHAGPGTPPMLLLHGDQDRWVSPSQTLLLHAALGASGIPSRRVVIRGADHGGPPWRTRAVMDLIGAHFDACLKPRVAS